MISSKTDENVLWQKYKQERSQQAKEKLVLKYLPLVKHIAGKVIVKLPDNFNFEDLVNYGVLGLMDALERFDNQRNIKFSTYAVPRIRGAIYDELRKLDWVPQSIRRKAKNLTKVYIKLENELKRTPTDQEVRAELDLTKQEFNKLLSEVNIPENISLERMISPQDGNKLRLKDLVEDPEGVGPENVFEFNEIKQVLAEAINKLPKKEKIVISLYYYEDLTLKEIGEILELTTARISQLHTKAIFRLRGHLSRKKDLLVG
ncbi:FliA/WhiG family RNA polymerase sigma factor [Natroniella sulfidigena]|uniref:FliA/WhiG family RNA polymerase sigma factor n=1 Tax=Natroniella sulfidigena TaxID=723921 RepID=UPI00200AABA5|nr:FliA/WhiG family RNA polymerase sigma factor [Natroniella sulfidigena]MCK8816505.1 FliA/WhiG family RNA polymerase sigma factor [Natroniella sulfidigena]